MKNLSFYICALLLSACATAPTPVPDCPQPKPTYKVWKSTSEFISGSCELYFYRICENENQKSCRIAKRQICANMDVPPYDPMGNLIDQE